MASQNKQVVAKSGVFSSGVDFLRDCREELNKVSRPTREETLKATATALFIVVFVSIALTLMDLLFNHLMKAVL